MKISFYINRRCPDSIYFIGEHRVFLYLWNEVNCFYNRNWVLTGWDKSEVIGEKYGFKKIGEL
jgi:hypothetical protein